jgi:hypothetical protein
MQRPKLALFALAFTSFLLAQDAPKPTDPLLAAKPRLKAALAKTVSTADTAFAASWSEDRKQQAAQNPLELAFAGRNKGKVTGSWHQGLLACKFDGNPEDELITAGRRTIAKDDNHAWSLRSGRFADGNTTPFVPDVELLLEQLAGWDLAIVRRDTGSLDDRPVEVLTVALNADQVTEATWMGLVPACLTAPIGLNEFRFNLNGNAGARPPATPPAAILDLAIVLDPAAGIVHELRFRAWNKQNAGGAGQVMVFRAGGGAVQAAGNDDEEDEDEKDTAKKVDAPMQYENGLPVRARKKMTIMDFTVRLQDHGKKAAPELTSEQKKLLGR